MAGCCGHDVWHNPSFVFLRFCILQTQKIIPPSTLHLIKSINTFIDYYIYIYRLSSHPYIFCVQKCKNTK